MESIVCARKRFDIAVAAEDPRNLIAELKGFFQVAAHPHSINLELSGSDLRAQIRTDPRYATFVAAAERKEVLGCSMPGRQWILSGGEARGRRIWRISPGFWSPTRILGRWCPKASRRSSSRLSILQFVGDFVIQLQRPSQGIVHRDDRAKHRGGRPVQHRIA